MPSNCAPLKKRLMNANASTLAKLVKGGYTKWLPKKVAKEREAVKKQPIRKRVAGSVFDSDLDT
jgi:hypothetical protein